MLLKFGISKVTTIELKCANTKWLLSYDFYGNWLPKPQVHGKSPTYLFYSLLDCTQLRMNKRFNFKIEALPLKKLIMQRTYQHALPSSSLPFLPVHLFQRTVESLQGTSSNLYEGYENINDKSTYRDKCIIFAKIVTCIKFIFAIKS